MEELINILFALSLCAIPFLGIQGVIYLVEWLTTVTCNDSTYKLAEFIRGIFYYLAVCVGFCCKMIAFPVWILVKRRRQARRQNRQPQMHPLASVCCATSTAVPVVLRRGK